MRDFNRTSIGAASLAPMVLLFIVSFALYGVYCFGTVTKVKVNGPFYSRIVQGKDVIADVLPPPAYLVETYLIAFQMYEDKDGATLPSLAETFFAKKADYVARHRYWSDHLAEGELKKTLVVDSYGPAMRMLAAIENDLIPALKAGDRAKAGALLQGPIGKEYADHRAAITRVVDLAMARNRDDEAGAAVAVKSRAFGQIGLGLMLIVLLSFLSWRWVRKAETANALSPTRA